MSGHASANSASHVDSIPSLRSSPHVTVDKLKLGGKYDVCSLGMTPSKANKHVEDEKEEKQQSGC